MKLAMVSAERATLGAVSFAARRRGHQVAEFEQVATLDGHLPFMPSVLILDGALLGTGTPTAVRSVAQRLPQCAIFVCMERPRAPATSEALRAGAHAIITVPFNPHELVLRAEAWVAGHDHALVKPDLLKLADLEIGLDQYRATKNGTELTLTRLELRLLFCLCEHSPNITPFERLIAFGWDPLSDPDAALIKTHISHIRHKLAAAGGVPFEITSRQGIGYMLRAPDGAQATALVA